jgi:hypothetical protein
MNNLEIFLVAFTSYIPRMDVNTGTAYYRLGFKLNGKDFSVKSATNESGRAGRVQFLQKGTDPYNTGKPIAMDCFTLIGISSAEMVKSSTDTLNALKEMVP